jgi:hypothetical protein
MEREKEGGREIGVERSRLEYSVEERSNVWRVNDNRVRSA